ncbi:hypothetical protein [Desulfovibrio psychrotolerans]|uniref:Uncharacterized protein n=1 Tax=Desulfovibrio psychrotolerans TaxID=415242 RepID=A0A7J0BZ48_9BACT|nr:hypothetical protein [Desulfovibrio psychrotolerans]GFM38465.1 hypothetical protein DSM19430T_31490 [Desulfovibrio psychrotolerans]
MTDEQNHFTDPKDHLPVLLAFLGGCLAGAFVVLAVAAPHPPMGVDYEEPDTDPDAPLALGPAPEQESEAG